MTEDVTLALSELRALIIKAARGAGLSWGMAEEAGWAAEWLARRGLPAADWATLWLDARLRGGQDPVETGVALADQLAAAAALTGAEGQTDGLPDGLPTPGYLLPFLHRIAQAHGAVELRAGSGMAARVLASGEVSFGPCWADRTTGWQLQRVTAVTPGAPRPKVSASVLDCLEGLALQTTVPPSARSRQDAGSVLGDND